MFSKNDIKAKLNLKLSASLAEMKSILAIEAVATIDEPPMELGDESGSEMSGYSQRMGIATKKFDKDNGSFTKKSERFGNGMVIYDYDK